MHEMDIGSLDLNLLRPLQLLLEERHVSRAAAAAGLTQPAMSRVLARLRSAFGDELLIRDNGLYVLTPRAEQLSRDLGVVMPALRGAIGGQTFDPASARLSFRVTCADAVAVFLGPALFRAIRRDSPKSTLEMRRWHSSATDDLARGATDLVFRAVDPGGDLRSEQVMRSRFVCVVSSDNRLADHDRINLGCYLKAEHVSVDLAEREQPIIDRRLGSIARSRNVALRVPDHATALAAVPGSDLVATLPAPFLSVANLSGTEKILGAPSELEEIDWLMVWHPLTTDDSAQRWLRDRVRKVAGPLDLHIRQARRLAGTEDVEGSATA